MSLHISLSGSGVVCGIFIYDLLLASNRMIFFSVKKFVERKFSPLTEKNSRGKITIAIDLRANNS